MYTEIEYTEIQEVHENLEEDERNPACCIFVFVIIVLLVFVCIFFPYFVLKNIA